MSVKPQAPCGKGCESCVEWWLQSDAMNIYGLLNPHSLNHMDLEGIEP